MRRVMSVVIGAVVLLFLAGCLPLSQDYYVRTPHRESPVDAEEDASQPAENAAGLHNAIMRMIKAGEEEGLIRARNYSGDLSADLPGVIRDISREEPEGAYAVDYMSYDIARMLTDYECNIHITYRRSKDQLDALIAVGAPGQIPRLLTDALTRYADVLSLDIEYYSPGTYLFDEILRSVYYENPETAMGLPSLTVALYPETGLRRIAEILIAYPDSAANLKDRARRAGIRAGELYDMAAGAAPGAPMALALYDVLQKHTVFDMETAQSAALRGSEASRNDSYTPYGALVGGKAVPEGWALTYKWLCDLAGIPCRVVYGRRGADEHVWNLIRLGDAWYHADPSADAREPAEGYAWFLCPDEVMLENYRWNRSEFPAAQGNEYTYEGLAGGLGAAEASSSAEPAPSAETE